MLVDSHCHLNFPEFAEDMEAVVARAQSEGVGVMQTICTKMHEFPAVLAIAEQFPNVYCSVGVHPHEADKAPLVSVEELRTHAAHPKVIGLGETGLDFYYEHSSRPAQEASFRNHITVARETGLPLIIHTRDADEDTVRILRDEWQKGAFPALIHCFTSSAWLAEQVLELGMYISISGIITFKSAQSLRDTVKDLPLNRLLVETDAPFLAPMPHRGKRNEPAFTAKTAAFLAELKGVAAEEVARQTTENFFTLFSKAKRG